ncbi:MAG: UTP--glucose-1-phosphate uridylyltransferase [Propionibacteriaceae bacterium]|jgi:UTP--glucose-1-phosphate uridylyltransferase|nr:UTP--glucose-1-phosphate uridylyltransferase [Propionibacteriaceae bacterium]
MSEQGLQACVAKMEEAGVDKAAIDVFAHNYRALESGASGLIPEDSIAPLLDPPRLADVPVSAAAGADALGKTVMIKLNGGLGTSMGLDGPKTLLTARDGKNFLDLIVGQVEYARQAYGVRLPLVLMNSFRTRKPTLEYLERYPGLAVPGLALDFLQNMEPKLLAGDLTPVSWPADPSLEWCPPGHGDLYTALWGTGLLRTLLDQGYRYASVANGDNLGAAPDARLAGWFAASGAPYAAEVCERTVNDRKGGHLAVRKSDGQLILRDTAQTPPEDMDYFTDEHRHPFFHCNNLWLDLERVYQTLAGRGGILGLPLIRNEKTVDPTDSSSPQVIQLESAMGAAIEVFPGATAIAVERDRFLPVKTTNELLLLRSDVFALGEDGRLRQQVAELPEVALDSKYYKLIDDFEERIPQAPSLLAAEALRVKGDWTFAPGVRIEGVVELADPGTPSVYA